MGSVWGGGRLDEFPNLRDFRQYNRNWSLNDTENVPF